jgi:type IV pilus assembly protein PilW
MRKSTKRSAGFTLIEIMIAIAIGLIGTIVMMQLFALSEGQKRTITSGGDAQTNGAIALHSLQRDVRQSGYGVSAYKLLGCDLALGTGVTLNAMTPFTINHTAIPGGDANTDTLILVSGNGNGSSEGSLILSTSASASPSYTVQIPASFSINDRVIAEPQTRPTTCALTLDTVASIAGRDIRVSNSTSGMDKGTLFNLGQRPSVLVYAVRNSSLTVCDYMEDDCGDSDNLGDTTVWVPVVSNIVSLKAQYGRDTSNPMDGSVDTYDQTVASPTTTPTVSTIQCGWARLSAVRIALVARSGQYEKTDVTTAAPTWAGSIGNPIDLSGDTNWRRYRYKTFESVVPIRNINWLGAQSGC